ncbi:HHL194Cp [Eremothecium sinecaudum]|uniref:HHL194Cp n=1 Tax=Eremothecium sinecaudum TaxID=45286 RepID=A0A120K2U2_9SACH|nr:HHL194Cp [Eremothecium sinecaudum]AMD22576.1 HHL194Cp [Eremothecium sinecaudum]
MSATIDDSKDQKIDKKTLFVRNLPSDATDDEFLDFFSQFVPVKHAVIVRDDEGVNRGFGFVSFAVEADTAAALAAGRKTAFKGRLLKIHFAKRRERESTKMADKESEDQESIEDVVPEEKTEQEEAESIMKGKPKLIIRNMPWSCRDSNKLKKIFGRFGTVVEASIPRNPDGRLRGFAFVTMKKISNCKKAIEECKDLKIDGRQVAVDFAVQKNRWEEFKEKHDTPKDEDDATGSASEAEDLEEAEKSSGSEDEEDEADLDDLVEANKLSEDIEEKPHAPKNRKETYSVFIRNLPYDATQEALEEFFSKFGPVKYALPVLDKETGLAKGTAFVAFTTQEAYEDCINNAPAVGSTSLLISDDVQPQYVYEGRVLSISPTLDRETANRNAERNAANRKEAFGIAPAERDRRNLYLMNEGKIVEGSKLAQLLTPAEMAIRQKSYQLRVEQIKKNPELHVSMTRLAIRNIPRAMNEASLKILARNAVVEFAKEVKEGLRHPLSKEEISRSTREKYKFMSEDEVQAEKKRDKKRGLIRQAKIIMEVKGSTTGRSKGYGFVEFRDHKSALMGLRWLNAHRVTREEIFAGVSEEEKKLVDAEGIDQRRLTVEFALENATVVKRRRERIKQSKESGRVKRSAEDDPSDVAADKNKKFKMHKKNDFHRDSRGNKDSRKKWSKDSNTTKGSPKYRDSKVSKDAKDSKTSAFSDDIKRLIGFKRKRRQGKK